MVLMEYIEKEKNDQNIKGIVSATNTDPSLKNPNMIPGIS
jgi:hypothetical protein